MNTTRFRIVFPGFIFLVLLLGVLTADATERAFTYSYEPETMPQGALEFEQWLTWRTQRNRAVGQADYHRWELREELEYGVTDDYTAALYINTQAVSFRAPQSGRQQSTFRFAGVSIENRYMALNPAEHAVGLAFYLEPRFSGDEAELEEKIILGQRYGRWKWALNLSHATEWEADFHDTEAEVEATFGLARDFGRGWSAGVELRNVNVLPSYKEWEYSAVYFGPVIGYRREKWWAALTVMPQIFGRNYSSDADGERNLVLDSQELVNVRFIVGITF